MRRDHDGLQPLGGIRLARRDSALGGQSRDAGRRNDQFGLPVAHVTFNLYDNDKKLIDCGKEKTEGGDARGRGAGSRAGSALRAPGRRVRAWERIPRTSVVDKFGRTHDIANLFVCDGSILPTQGSANPGLTIQALAARTADYLISQGDRDLQLRPARHDATAHTPRAFSARHTRSRCSTRGQRGTTMKPQIEILEDKAALARRVAE